MEPREEQNVALGGDAVFRRLARKTPGKCRRYHGEFVIVLTPGGASPPLQRTSS
jgi:hypothetical protein